MPSRSREPFLASALARPQGPDARQRTELWAKSAAARLSELGLNVCSAPGDAGANVDHGPSLAPPALASFTRVVLAFGERVVLQESRASIVLVLGEGQVEVAVELPPAAAGVARERISDPVRALELTTALEALPEQFAIGIVGAPARLPASLASTDQIRELLDRSHREEHTLWLGWSVPRAVALAHAMLLDEQLEDAVVALGSVFAMLAPPVGRAAPGSAGASTNHGGSAVPRVRPASRRRDKRDGLRGDDERPGAKRRARERDQRRERAGDLALDRDSREQESAAEPRMQRVASAKVPVQAGVRRNLGSAGKTIGKGSRVRVLDGPFFGKVGVVQELDGKGGARVMLGLLAVRVDVRDLARCAEGRGRPVLSTSHRKPQPARS